MTQLALPTPLTGPNFGSYAPNDVVWLLKDLSAVSLEAPTEERERAIQSGDANYAQSLPVEYSPSSEYQALYASAVIRTGSRIATAVGVVTELCLAARENQPVLVSLARAGTPIGILMKRWAEAVHGLELPHLTLSIVRGVGLDPVALRYLSDRFDPERIIFVDGWTGKGAITRELTAALDKFAKETGIRFKDDLAVLADPAYCVSLFGTREDYLIPSACLNSTVSGLVSRTVFNTDYIGENDFHGAKFYAEFSDSDVSNRFLDDICAHFAQVREEVVRLCATRPTEEPVLSWAGWKAVEQISERYGINNVNLVKPGVGETTRVLLRRVPWKVLVNPERRNEIDHVLLLAEQRAVPVEEVPNLPYSCVGLIHPKYDKSAVGADGKAVFDA